MVHSPLHSYVATSALGAAGNVFLWDRLSTALGNNAPARFLQDFLVPAAYKAAAVARPAMPAAPTTSVRRGGAGARGRSRASGRQRPPATDSAQGHQHRAAEVLQQVAAAAEAVLGVSIAPSQPLMDAGLDSLGMPTLLPRPEDRSILIPL